MNAQEQFAYEQALEQELDYESMEQVAADFSDWFNERYVYWYIRTILNWDILNLIGMDYSRSLFKHLFGR